VDGAKRAPPNLLLHQILVDAVLGGAVILAVTVLRARIQRFLGAVSCRPVYAGSGAKATFTWRVDEAARLWCLSGLRYAGVDLVVYEPCPAGSLT
jgi:hypothetical protein